MCALPKRRLASFLAAHPRTVLVEVVGVKGSTPRETGAIMAVSETSLWGTIGGGQLEYMAIDNARAVLAGGGEATMDVPLGPQIGQCCGGRVRLCFRIVTEAVASEVIERLRMAADNCRSVYIFGAGHVGKALADTLSSLPFRTIVIETRRDELAGLPDSVESRLTALPEKVARDAPPGSLIVIMTHDHALDFLIAREALSRKDLTYVGMIGSATKRATFSRWLTQDACGRDDWLTRLTLPIGGSSIRDKRPEVIAVMVAAEMLSRAAVTAKESGELANV